MYSKPSAWAILAATAICGFQASELAAQQSRAKPDAFGVTPLRLAWADQASESPAMETKETKVSESAEGSPYREISDFFNVREANSSVEKGAWEFEVPLGWATRSDDTDDDFFVGPSLKYGITDTLFLELEVLPVNIGDGGDQGNGDLALIVFNQFVKEGDLLPAIAAWSEMRIPSGQGSSGVDASLHLNLTKTIFPRFRVHLEGYIETANGERGGEEGGEGESWAFPFGFGGESGGDRRHFQWGVGPGFDYQFDDKTIGVLNYVNRSSEEEGHHNQNILQVGFDRQIVEGQHLKAAVDVGLDGGEESPNLAVKLQYSIEWR